MKIENDVQVTEPGADSIIPTMQAGKAHVKWMVSSYRPESEVGPGALLWTSMRSAT